MGVREFVEFVEFVELMSRLATLKGLVRMSELRRLPLLVCCRLLTELCQVEASEYNNRVP